MCTGLHKDFLKLKFRVLARLQSKEKNCVLNKCLYTEEWSFAIGEYLSWMKSVCRPVDTARIKSVDLTCMFTFMAFSLAPFFSSNMCLAFFKAVVSFPFFFVGVNAFINFHTLTWLIFRPLSWSNPSSGWLFLEIAPNAMWVLSSPMDILWTILRTIFLTFGHVEICASNRMARSTGAWHPKGKERRLD